jgi:hypothetical protein
MAINQTGNVFQPIARNTLGYFLVECAIAVKLSLYNAFRDCTAKLVRNTGLGIGRRYKGQMSS